VLSSSPTDDDGIYSEFAGLRTTFNYAARHFDHVNRSIAGKRCISSLLAGAAAGHAHRRRNLLVFAADDHQELVIEGDAGDRVPTEIEPDTCPHPDTCRPKNSPRKGIKHDEDL